MKAKEDAAEKAKAEEAERFIEEQITGWKEGIAAHVQAESEQFELISHYGQPALDLVWAVTEQYHDAHDGKLLPIADACKLVEEHLAEEASRILGLKRFSQKAGASTDVKPQGMSQPPQRTTTITNQQTLSSAPVDTKGMSEEESRQLAISMIKWKTT
jgi:hypothetical protein